MLLQPEDGAIEGAGHVERAVAIFEAAIAPRHHHLPFRHKLAVEAGDSCVGGRRYRSPPSAIGPAWQGNDRASSKAPSEGWPEMHECNDNGYHIPCAHCIAVSHRCHLRRTTGPFPLAICGAKGNRGGCCF